MVNRLIFFFGGLMIVIILLMIGIILLVYAIAIPINHICFRGEKAQIEQFKKDVLNIKGEMSEDVIGQVVRFNQRIASNKEYNKVWWAAIAIPNGWEQIDYIEVPKTTN